jgi:hypothetical protein
MKINYKEFDPVQTVFIGETPLVPTNSCVVNVDTRLSWGLMSLHPAIILVDLPKELENMSPESVGIMVSQQDGGDYYLTLINVKVKK